MLAGGRNSLWLLTSTLTSMLKPYAEVDKRFTRFCFCRHWGCCLEYFKKFSEDESCTSPKDKFSYSNMVALQNFSVLIVCDTPSNLQLAVRFLTKGVLHSYDATLSCIFNLLFTKVAGRLGD